MATEKKILGQAWIYKNVSTTIDDTDTTNSGTKVVREKYTVLKESLVQDVIVIPDTLKEDDSYSQTVTLIDDIWDNLCKGEGGLDIKTNGKGYFYWEYKLTPTDKDAVDDITVQFECPRPTYEILVEKGVLDVTSVADITLDILKAKAEDIKQEVPESDYYKPKESSSDQYLSYWLDYFVKAEENVLKHETVQKGTMNVPAYVHDVSSTQVDDMKEVEAKDFDNTPQTGLGDLNDLLMMF